MLRKLSVLILAVIMLCSITSISSADAKTIALITRNVGNPYATKIVEGFQEACTEYGYTAIVKEPAEPTAELAIQAINELISQNVAAIALPATDAAALTPALTKAIAAGIKIISWDSAVEPSVRITNTVQANMELIGRIEVQGMAEMLGEEGGQIAVVSATAESEGQNIWISWMKEELKDPKYAKIELVKVVYGDDLRDKSVSETEGLLKAYPDLKGIIAPTTVGIAAAAKVITDKGLQGKLHLTGLGLPSEMAEYIHNGACEWMYLWNPIDMGYFTACTVIAAVEGKITGAVGDVYTAGRLGEKTIIASDDGGTQVMMGAPFKFDINNIDEWKVIY
jgi:rhamnose transport system substrate-binding protein